jgi:hypothetical protein
LSGDVLTLQPAGVGFPGGLSAGTQSISGRKTFVDGITLNSLAQEGATNGQALLWSSAHNQWMPGTGGGSGASWGFIGGTLTDQLDLVAALNAKNISLAVVGSTPNTSGASVVGQQLQLQPADLTNPGVLVAGIQNAGKVVLAGLEQDGATSGQVLGWNGSAWVPTTSGGAGGSGWIYVADVAVSGGAVSNKTYEDPSNTVLTGCTVSALTINISVRASYPKIVIGASTYWLTRDTGGGYYSGTISATVAAGTVTLTVYMPNDTPGASVGLAIAYDAPPTILTLAFTGSYPGTQTQLKAGDTFSIAGTTDVGCTGVEIENYGACVLQTITFASTTSFTVTGAIADRGTTTQALAAQLKARNAAGAYGALALTSNTVNLNNTYPTITLGTITYPGSQQALKNSETATVAATYSNTDTVSFTSPNGDLSITNPGTIEATKTVTRIAGSYNVSVNNMSVVGTRTANAAQSTTSKIINIANVAPTISVSTPAARLRSGGSDGTPTQSHTITITSNQQLASAPTMLEGASGVFTSSWVGGPTVYTRSLLVSDSFAKGSYTFNGLVATGLSGLVQNTISSGAGYVLGGFVARSLTFSAFSQSTTMNVAVTTYSKVQAGIFTATNQPALRNATQGDHSNILNTFTVDSIGSNPTTVWWNDVAAASTNSTGTAQIVAIEEIV